MFVPIVTIMLFLHIGGHVNIIIHSIIETHRTKGPGLLAEEGFGEQKSIKFTFGHMPGNGNTRTCTWYILYTN